jgi:hypothetical protein
MALTPVRDAFQIAVHHTLINLVMERKAEIRGNLNDLALEIIDTFEFGKDFEEMLEEHLIIYGEMYGI